MNIAQIKVVSWTAAALLTIGLSGYVWTFVSGLEARRALPDPNVVRATLTGVEPVAAKNDGQIAYTEVKRLFYDLNWTGLVKAPPKVDTKGPEDLKPELVPVKELVRVLWVQVDLADPKGSAVFLKYRPKANVQNSPIGGFLVREGDALLAPHAHVRVDAITVGGVVFSFADANRAKETLLPEEYDAKASIVQVGPDGVVLPPPKTSIPRVGGVVFKPGKTTPLGRGRYVLGSEDLKLAEQNYTEILSQDVRLRQHRDPRTGRYDGIEIADVTPGSFAERHGAQAGDVVKSINGHAVSSTQEAINFVKMNKDKFSVWEVVIENKGKTRTVTYESPQD
jgi:hypothetical protein